MLVAEIVLGVGASLSLAGLLAVYYWYLMGDEDFISAVHHDVLIATPFCNEDELSGFLSVQHHLKDELQTTEQIVPCRSIVMRKQNPKSMALLGHGMNPFERQSRRFFMIMDSNTAALPYHLSAMRDAFRKKNTAVVFAPVAATNPVSSSDFVDATMVNTTVAKAMILSGLLGLPYAIGKSMMIDSHKVNPREALEASSGFIAEDTAIAKFAKRKGYRTRISSKPIIQTYLANTGYQPAFGRILRWFRIQMWSNPVVFMSIPLENAIVQGALMAVIAHRVDAVFCWTAIQYLLDRSCYKIMDQRGCLPVSIWIRKQVYFVVAWIVSPLSASVLWRGNRIRLGRSGRIV